MACGLHSSGRAVTSSLVLSMSTTLIVLISDVFDVAAIMGDVAMDAGSAGVDGAITAGEESSIERSARGSGGDVGGWSTVVAGGWVGGWRAWVFCV